MTNIVKTSMATVNEANAATASGDATSADALFSALFSLMKPGASEDEVTAALDAAVLAEHAVAAPEHDAETLLSADDAQAALNAVTAPAETNPEDLMNILAGMPLAAGKVATGAETADGAAMDSGAETSDIAPALPQLTHLLARLTREGEAGGAGMERTGRAGMRPLGKAEAHQQLVRLMALAREMVATAAADAPDQVVEPAADPDQPLPQMAQKSAAVTSDIQARIKPEAVKPLPLDAGADAETNAVGTAARKNDLPAQQSVPGSKVGAARTQGERSLIGPHQNPQHEQVIAQQKMATGADQKITIETAMKEAAENIRPAQVNASGQTSSTTVASVTTTGGSATGDQPQGEQQGEARGRFDQAASKAEMVQHRRLNMMGRDWQAGLVRMVQNAAADGQQQMTVQLAPKRLGQLQMQLNVAGETTIIQIRADNAMAASMLGEAEARLSQMFTDQGMRLASLDVQHGQRGGEGQMGQQARQEQDGGTSGGKAGRAGGEKQNEPDGVKDTETEVANTGSRVNILA